MSTVDSDAVSHDAAVNKEEAPNQRGELRFALDLFGAWTKSEIGGVPFNRFALPRAELGAYRDPTAPLGGELRLEAIRSAGPQSLLGVDGDSLVFRLKRGWLYRRWSLGDHRLRLAAGLLMSPLIEGLQNLEGHRGAAPLLAESSGLFEAAELGLSVSWRGRLFKRALLLRLMSSNGEGRRLPEQNEGKDTSLLLNAELWARGTKRLSLLLMGREGSRGLASAPAHRAVAALAWEQRVVRIGGAAYQAWGFAGRGDWDQRAFEFWGSVAPFGLESPGLMGRYERQLIDQQFGTVSSASRFIAGLFFPLAARTDHAGSESRLYLIYQQDMVDSALSPIPGLAAAGTGWQLSLRFALRFAEDGFIP
ncbi:MAG: hypothetical protein VYD19_08780 [Myxococcota bacterium]|nr:hypothetical protein [Myxococcota bacterium]